MRRVVPFDSTRWTAQSVSQLRFTVRDRMFEQLATPEDVWAAFLARHEPSRRLTHEQLKDAMYGVFGFEVVTAWEHEVFEVAYKEMDDDSSGEISFDEFLNWMNGRAQRRRRAKGLSLQSLRPVKGMVPWEKIVWNPAVIRTELHAMLIRGEVSTLDLLGAHDRSDDGKLDEQEFLKMMRLLISDDDAWRERGARNAALRVFRAIGGDDRQVDIGELEGWMIRGLDVMLAMQRAKRNAAPEPKSYEKVTASQAVAQGKMASRSAPNLKNGEEAKQTKIASDEKIRPTDVEEQSYGGQIGGRGLAARWLLRNSSLEDVLSMRKGYQLRVVPGADQLVAKAGGAGFDVRKEFATRDYRRRPTRKPPRRLKPIDPLKSESMVSVASSSLSAASPGQLLTGPSSSLTF